MLAPPVLEAQTAREMFERGYLMDLTDACGSSFNEFGKAVIAAREMRESAQGMRQTVNTTRLQATNVRSANTTSAMGIKRSGLLNTSNTLSAQYSILGRHRIQKVRPDVTTGRTISATEPAPNTQFASIGIPQFLKRMSMGVMSK